MAYRRIFAAVPLTRKSAGSVCRPCKSHRFRQLREIRHHGSRLFRRCVLPQGHKVIVLRIQQQPDIFRRCPQCIIGGDCQHNGFLPPEHGLYRHGRCGIRDAVRQLCGGIGSTGCHHQQIQQVPGAKRLCLCNAANRRFAADLLQFGNPFCRCAETGIYGGGMLRENRVSSAPASRSSFACANAAEKVQNEPVTTKPIRSPVRSFMGNAPLLREYCKWCLR